MRAVFGVIALLLVLAVVGVLAKKQLGTGLTPTAAQTPAPGSTVTAPSGAPREQVRQIEQAVQGAMQQPRAMPDEGK
jgi:hypothetical protein